jgi:hypothetical protein
MRRTVIRGLVFAVTLTATSLAFDLLFTAFHQEGFPHGVTRQFIVFRSALHGATLVLTAVGALLGFAFLRSYSIANTRIVTIAAFLGMINFAALSIAFQVAGFSAMTLWLVLASAVVSYAGGRLLGTRGTHVTTCHDALTG